MTGTLKVDGSGNVELQETDGIDYAATTVQLPGGERVPFLFTVKNLNAKGTLDAFGGEFVVPSYRGATFLDPKVGRISKFWGSRGSVLYVLCTGEECYSTPRQYRCACWLAMEPTTRAAVLLQCCSRHRAATGEGLGL
jgi:hypothetical protein